MVSDGCMHRLRVSRLIPTTLRAPLLRVATRVLVPPARPGWVRPAQGRVTIAGVFSSPSGIGEGARLAAERLSELGYAVGAIDLTPGLGWPGGLPFGSPAIAGDDIGGPLIVHLNPPFFQIALLRLLRRHRAGRKLIACWAWELSEMPPSWRQVFPFVHEVWVPSAFVAEALARSGCPCPVRVVPHPVRIPPSATAVPRVERGFTVLTVFAYDSGFERKNPIGAIQAFRRAFAEDDTARLLLKARGCSRSGQAEQRLRAAVAGAANVEVMEADLSSAAYQRLVESADVLLSLHRAEGFGLPLAEAMLRSKPVVATGWSGNLEFMNEASACLVPAGLVPVVDGADAYRGVGGMWAAPSIDAAAAWLARLRNPALRERIGLAARSHAAARLGPAAFSAAVRPSLDGHGGTD